MSPKVTLIDAQIAKVIRGMRDDRKLTQPDVAGFLGISYQSYQKMERGVVSFRASTIAKLAEIFNVPVGAVMDQGLPTETKNGAEIARVAIMMYRSSPETAHRIMQYALGSSAGETGE